VPDAELDGPRLAREVAALLAAPARLRAMSEAASRVSRPDAAAFIARETLAVAREAGRGERARRAR
jgi:UDP-N-acetylglucosamine:LPS N-acetylglucosamine transferase